MFTFTIVSSKQWKSYHLRPAIILPVLYITNVAIMASLTPWHEPNMVHVRLLFLQPDLCDVNSWSLMFIGALDELQHFIWSLEWIELGSFGCKAPRVSIFEAIVLNCIKWRIVCNKGISPYGNLEMYMDYVFIERLIGWRQGLLLWDTCQSLSRTCNTPGHYKLKWSIVLAW